MAEQYDFTGLTPKDTEEYDFSGLETPQYNFEGLTPVKEKLMTPIEEPKVGKAEAALAGFEEGASLGFGDELAGVVGAAIDRPVSYLIDMYKGVPEDLRGEPETSTFGERYRQTRDIARRRYEEAQQEQPGAYLLGQVGGGVATGIATGGVGAGANLASLGTVGKVLTSPVGRNIAKVVSSPVGGGAAYGLGASEADLLKGEYGRAAKDVALGGVAGASLPIGIAAVKGSGKLAKEAGKLITGLGGEANELAVKGASKILGVAENELTPEIVTYLKQKGLSGFKGKKEQILATIQKDVDLINQTRMQNPFATTSDIPEKALEIMQKSDQSFIKEAIRTGKDVDLGDVASLALGPKAYAAKKTREMLASRAQLKAPEIYQKSQKALDFGKKIAETPVIKQSIETTGKLYDKIYSTPAINMPFGQFQFESVKAAGGQENALGTAMKYGFTSDLITQKVQGTKYERVFNPQTIKENAVRHKLLMERDPEYRKLFNEQLNEE